MSIWTRTMACVLLDSYFLFYLGCGGFIHRSTTNGVVNRRLVNQQKFETLDQSNFVAKKFDKIAKNKIFSICMRLDYSSLPPAAWIKHNGKYYQEFWLGNIGRSLMLGPIRITVDTCHFSSAALFVGYVMTIKWQPASFVKCQIASVHSIINLELHPQHATDFKNPP